MQALSPCFQLCPVSAAPMVSRGRAQRAARCRSAAAGLLLLFVCFTGAGRAEAQPTVTTDKPDYGPTETVALSGSGFGVGEALFVLVAAPDGSTYSGDGTGSPGPDVVTTDAEGAFSLSYRLFGTLPNGDAYEGQLGIYSVSVRDEGGTVLATTSFGDSQGHFSCALTTGGGVKCWGYNYYGSLGTGSFSQTWPYYGISTPVDVSGLGSGVAQVSVGYLHACALTTGGSVKCWGYNSYGQLGSGAVTFSSATPVAVSGLTSGVVHVSAGVYHTCALLASGSVKCWGYNEYGQLGTGAAGGYSPTPVDVSGFGTAVQIAAGAYHTCAVTASGGVKCWGQNYYGQLGNGTFNQSYPYAVAAPVDVSGLGSGVAQVKAGYHTCAVTTAGGVKCWGYGGAGALGDGTFNSSSTPVNVSGLSSGIAQISLGWHHTCALTVSGGAKCWGYNWYGAAGDGSVQNVRPTPADVAGLTSGAAQISAGGYHTCAVTSSGGAKCWGYNYEGQLGNGTFTQSSPYGSPTPGNVSGLTSGVASLWDGEPIATSVDTTAPTANPTHTPAPNAAGWNNTDVVVSWNWTDEAGGSGIDAGSCTTSTTSAGEGNPLTLNASCADLAGNTGEQWYSVQVDKTRPSIGASATTASNGAGWYTGDVAVAFTCDDNLSGVSGPCPADQVLSGEGAAISSSPMTVSDVAGNVSAPSNVVAVKIDKTAPTVSLAGGPAHGGSYYFGAVPAAPACAASDALSGLDGGCTVAGYSTAVGAHTVTATARDKAGHQASASLTYTVLAWTFAGFYQPVDINGVWNVVKNGSTVPIKFEVFAGSTELTDTAAVVQPLMATQSACSGGPTDDIELVATGGTSLRYDAAVGQFIYNWQTPRRQGYCYVVTVMLADGTARSARFQLK